MMNLNLIARHLFAGLLTALGFASCVHEQPDLYGPPVVYGPPIDTTEVETKTGTGLRTKTETGTKTKDGGDENEEEGGV